MKDKHQTIEPAGVSEERLREFAFGPRHRSPMFSEMESMACELLAARQQLAEMRADAVRYRWLREHRDVSLITDFFGNGCVNKTVEMVDAAIDAALAPTSQPSRGKCETCGGKLDDSRDPTIYSCASKHAADCAQPERRLP